MADALATARRLRAEVGCPPDAPLDAEDILPRHYPITCVRLPGLCVSSLRDYLARHDAMMPPGLVACRDRRLRGGIVAAWGHGILFADADDPENERRFTFAHEGCHYLRDHLYPRLDLLARFGPGLRDVLDGRRAPTLAERVDALLARTSLTMHTHLLERDRPASAVINALEAEAEAFACEILAPRAALEQRFPRLIADKEAITQVQTVLLSDYGLPDAPACAHAAAFVADHGVPQTLLHRLGLLEETS